MSFNVDDFVFVKTRGFRSWPAKIIAVNNKLYDVFYFGTNDFGLKIKATDICQYNTNKIRLGKLEKNKSVFNEAMKQIEAAIKENDIGPSAADYSSRLHLQLAKDEEKKKNLVKKRNPKLKTIAIEKKKQTRARLVEAKVQSIEIPVLSQPQQESDNAGQSSLQQEEEDLIENQRPIKTNSNKKLIFVDMRKRDLLKTEIRLSILVTDIQNAITTEHSDTAVCIQKLTDFKTLSPNISKIMLLKNPHFVESVKLLKNYVGKFGMTNIEKEKLKPEFKKIRNLATEVYDIFKTIFSYNQESFWEYFSNKVADFDEKTKKISEIFLGDLCFENEYEKNAEN